MDNCKGENKFHTFEVCSVNARASRLEAERLILGEITEKDTPLIVKWRSDPKVYRYFFSPHPLTAEEHLDWYKNQYLHQNNRVDWIAVEKVTGKPVGIFGIKREKAGDTETEVSYLLAPEFRGKGYAAEAVDRILKFASKQWLCHSAVARIHGDNQESIRFIGNLGFVWLETVGNFVTYRKTLVKKDDKGWKKKVVQPFFPHRKENRMSFHLQL